MPTIETEASDRGITTALNYAMLLAALAILVTLLVTGFSGAISDQSERAARAELEVAGNRLAGDLSTAARLARASGGQDIGLTAALPNRVVGVPYKVTVTNASAEDSAGYRYRLTLRTRDASTAITVDVRTQRPVRTGTFDGGRLTLTYRNGTVVISDA